MKRIKGVWVDKGTKFVGKGEVHYGEEYELIEEPAANGRPLVRQIKKGQTSGTWLAHRNSWFKDDVRVEYEDDTESPGNCEGNWDATTEACSICSIRERCKNGTSKNDKDDDAPKGMDRIAGAWAEFLKIEDREEGATKQLGLGEAIRAEITKSMGET